MGMNKSIESRLINIAKELEQLAFELECTKEEKKGKQAVRDFYTENSRDYIKKALEENADELAVVIEKEMRKLL